MDADGRLRLDYEQTTGQISALTDVRFKLLSLVPTIALAAVGTLFRAAPSPRVITPSGRHHRLFGAVTVGQDQALGLVYGAALGGWTYLLVWRVLRGLHVSGARAIGGVIGACCWAAVALEVRRISKDATRCGRKHRG